MSASYFKKIDMLLSPEYLPDDQDVFHTYLKTARTVDTRLKIGKFDCVVTDVGGTRSEREERVRLSNSAHCINFTVSLSGYDQRLIEDDLRVDSLFPETLLLKCSYNLLTRSR